MVKINVGVALAFTALMGATPIAAETASTVQASPAANAAIQPNAQILAQFLFPRELVQKQVAGALDSSLKRTLTNDPDTIVLETEYPGLMDAMFSALKPVMLKAYDDKLPLLWDGLARVYTDNFTEADLVQLLTFYRGPVGVRYMAALRQNADNASTIKAALESGGLSDSVSAAAKKESLATIRKANAQTSAADKVAIFRFENSPVGRKLATITPQTHKVQLDWDFHYTEKQVLEFATARSTAAGDFISKVDADRVAKTAN